MKIPPKSSEICRNSRNKPVHLGILGGTIKPCFCIGLGVGTEYSGGIGRYGTKSSSLVKREKIIREKLEVLLYREEIMWA